MGFKKLWSEKLRAEFSFPRFGWIKKGFHHLTRLECERGPRHSIKPPEASLAEPRRCSRTPPLLKWAKSRDSYRRISNPSLGHIVTNGRFRKRVVLANVLSFRFSFQENMRTYPRSSFRSGGTSECTLVPVFVPGGTSAKTALLENRPFGNPRGLASSTKTESVLTTSMSKQRGFTKSLLFPETSEFTKPPGSYEFCGFSFRTRKEPRSSAGFCQEGTKLDWTYFKQFL